MKKFTRLTALVLASALILVGCTPSTGSDTGPSIQAELEAAEAVENKTVDEAKVVEALKVLEAYSDKNVRYEPLDDPNDEYNLNIIKNVHMIAVETGDYSINNTKEQFGIGGTDLGISIRTDDYTLLAFGDTVHDEERNTNWRSNVLAITTDTDYTDGIIFDDVISEPGSNSAMEFIPSRKIDNLEMTTIPTGGIVIDDNIYISYMSVKTWGAHGDWAINHSGISKSTDGGETWNVIEGLEWDGYTHFGQMAPVIIDDYVYVLGITGGRNNHAKLMRVPIDQYEDIDAYEYMMGYDESGEPYYEQGENAMYRGHEIIPGEVGEMSIMYSEYLEEWMVTFLRNDDLVMVSSKEITGPYSNPVTIAAQADFPGLYGGFMNPDWVSEDGSKIGFLMSVWHPVYNVVLMEMELEK